VASVALFIPRDSSFLTLIDSHPVLQGLQGFKGLQAKHAHRCACLAEGAFEVGKGGVGGAELGLSVAEGG
jgi:hypothetical protein